MDIGLLMHVLLNNPNQGINNYCIPNIEIQGKLCEEAGEVIEALEEYKKNKTLSNLKEITRETYDVIQICILILYRVNRKAIDFDYPGLIKEINNEHNEKLSKRSWEFLNSIQIKIKELEKDNSFNEHILDRFMRKM